MSVFFKNRGVLLLLLLVATMFVSCSDQTNVAYPTVKYSSYTDIKKGNVWYYKLDSTALANFGEDTVVRHYMLKDSVVNNYLDGEGQQTYKVFRYIRPYTATSGWNYLNSYNLTTTADRLEMIDEDNLRFIKLVTPVSEAYTWDGNAYFTKNTSVSSDSAIAYYFGWNYEYQDVNTSVDFGNSHFDSTVTVSQANIINGNTGDFDESIYSEKIIAKEMYARHIGMIYRKVLHLTWQPKVSGSQSWGYTGESYGIEMWMVRE